MADLLILLSGYIMPRWNIVKEIFQNSDPRPGGRFIIEKLLFEVTQ
jgi:hypothetical protein